MIQNNLTATAPTQLYSVNRNLPVQNNQAVGDVAQPGATTFSSRGTAAHVKDKKEAVKAAIQGGAKQEAKMFDFSVEVPMNGSRISVQCHANLQGKVETGQKGKDAPVYAVSINCNTPGNSLAGCVEVRIPAGANPQAVLAAFVRDFVAKNLNKSAKELDADKSMNRNRFTVKEDGSSEKGLGAGTWRQDPGAVNYGLDVFHPYKKAA